MGWTLGGVFGLIAIGPIARAAGLSASRTVSGVLLALATPVFELLRDEAAATREIPTKGLTHHT